MSQPDQESLQQVLAYIDRIEAYEGATRAKIFATNDLAWGLLFVYAGIMDLVLSLLDQGALAWIPWMLSSLTGIIISLFISRKRKVEAMSVDVERSFTSFAKLNKSLMVIIILGWLLTSILGIYQLEYLIMPWISVMVGTSIIGFMRLYGNVSLSMIFNPNTGLPFIALLAYGSAVINLLGYVLLGQEMQVYMGLVAGMMIGLGFINAARQRL